MSKKRRDIKSFAVSCFGGCCGVCGYSKCLRALEFHHLDPSSKDFTPSSKTFSRERLIEELAKCICLCSNCHREVHDSLLYIDDSVRRFSLPPELPAKEPMRSNCEHCHSSFVGDRRFCTVECSNLSKIKSIWPSDGELALLVWEFPKTILGKALGVSDRAVAKRCAKLNIPQPERGFWAKKRSTN